MDEPSLDDPLAPVEVEIRALIVGWRQTLGGPPKNDLTQALIATYNTLDRREAQIAQLQPNVQYAAPLRETLEGLLVERDRLRTRLADLYTRWRAVYGA
ncbi:MAG: hypothetical protein M5U01_37135 [Ardenticatenaceae bacterium]|nr:hypothetical protein [Ardenticatenaceae bacterium]HBY93872.1 hypothetical protein [Chloroflexota bacterium]